jgi:hydroxyacylglutathione hydrolase
MIHCIYGQNYDSNIYVITGKHPSIVDCGTGLHAAYVEKTIARIIDLTDIDQIILTHEHYDHCGGVKHLYQRGNEAAKIIAHLDASEKIEKGDSSFAQLLGGVMPKIPVDQKVRDGDLLILGDDSFRVLHTPGHTPGSMCLYSEQTKSLISGDTVFSHGAFGRYDFPGGDPRALSKSIERLATLDVVNLYPGHQSIVEGEGALHMKMVETNIQYLR